MSRRHSVFPSSSTVLKYIFPEINHSLSSLKIIGQRTGENTAWAIGSGINRVTHMNVPPGSPGFREAQCSAFDGQDFGISGLPSSHVTWKPYFKERPEDLCKLYCNAVGTTSYFMLKEKVIDGTPCPNDDVDTTSVCVNGRCLAAGCDHVLNSGVKKDSCGICGGNNSTCRMVRGHFNPSIVRFGYSRVTVIPEGASNVVIKQISSTESEDSNYLSLRDDSKYILNGDYIISPYATSIDFHKSIVDYSGCRNQTEVISIQKPLVRKLVVEVLSVGNLNPPNVLYEYSSPSSPSVGPFDTFKKRHDMRQNYVPKVWTSTTITTTRRTTTTPKPTIGRSSPIFKKKRKNRQRNLLKPSSPPQSSNFYQPSSSTTSTTPPPPPPPAASSSRVSPFLYNAANNRRPYDRRDDRMRHPHSQYYHPLQLRNNAYMYQLYQSNERNNANRNRYQFYKKSAINQ